MKFNKINLIDNETEELLLLAIKNFAEISEKISEN